MHRITNRQKRVFVIAPVPNPDDEGKDFPAVTIDPGATESVPKAQWMALRRHSAQIFDHLVGNRLLIVDGVEVVLHADELQNPVPPKAPDDLAIMPDESSGVTLETKTSVSEVQLAPETPAEAPRPNRRRA